MPLLDLGQYDKGQKLPWDLYQQEIDNHVSKAHEQSKYSSPFRAALLMGMLGLGLVFLAGCYQVGAWIADAFK